MILKIHWYMYRVLQHVTTVIANVNQIGNIQLSAE